MSFSLLTLNLHTYQQHPMADPMACMHQHEREINFIAEAIAGQKIDVACFQEVGEWCHDPITSPYGISPSNMVNRIRTRLANWGIHYHMFQDWSHIGYGQFREGTAILSRFPMRHNHSRYVSSDQRRDWYMSRNITATCIELPWFGLVHISNVHLNWPNHGFYNEFDTVRWLISSRQWIRPRADLIVGDFNVPAGSHAYDHVAGSGEYVDQFYLLHPQRFFEPTFLKNADGWDHMPPSRIDYIFGKADNALHIRQMEPIFTGQFYPVVSDHYGYLARFDLS